MLYACYRYALPHVTIFLPKRLAFARHIMNGRGKESRLTPPFCGESPVQSSVSIHHATAPQTVLLGTALCIIKGFAKGATWMLRRTLCPVAIGNVSIQDAVSRTWLRDFVNFTTQGIGQERIWMRQTGWRLGTVIGRDAKKSTSDLDIAKRTTTGISRNERWVSPSRSGFQLVQLGRKRKGTFLSNTGLEAASSTTIGRNNTAGSWNSISAVRSIGTKPSTTRTETGETTGLIIWSFGSTSHLPGQRIEERVRWAREILIEYGDLVDRMMVEA